MLPMLYARFCRLVRIQSAKVGKRRVGLWVELLFGTDGKEMIGMRMQIGCILHSASIANLIPFQRTNRWRQLHCFEYFVILSIDVCTRPIGPPFVLSSFSMDIRHFDIDSLCLFGLAVEFVRSSGFLSGIPMLYHNIPCDDKISVIGISVVHYDNAVYDDVGDTVHLLNCYRQSLSFSFCYSFFYFIQLDATGT